VAAALFYVSLAKVLVVQYGNIRIGLISIKSSVDSVDALRRKIFQGIGAFVVNFGYLPRLFKFSFKKAKEVDEDDIGSRKTVVVEPSEDLTTFGGDQGSDEDSTNSKPRHDYEEPGDDDDDDEDAGEDDKPRFKPFFFLDNIIT
jgi:hypothetical protein